jgi:hypothetical protein
VVLISDQDTFVEPQHFSIRPQEDADGRTLLIENWARRGTTVEYTDRHTNEYEVFQLNNFNSHVIFGPQQRVRIRAGREELSLELVTSQSRDYDTAWNCVSQLLTQQAGIAIRSRGQGSSGTMTPQMNWTAADAHARAWINSDNALCHLRDRPVSADPLF